jgi:hypothetical protein
MKIVTENHFGLTYRFFQLQGIHLIQALSENGIRADENQTKSILEVFLASMAIDLDQFFIRDKELGDRRFYPMVCFRDCERINKAQEIVLPDGNDAFHETLPYGVRDDLMEFVQKKLGFFYGNECQEIQL